MDPHTQEQIKYSALTALNNTEYWRMVEEAERRRATLLQNPQKFRKKQLSNALESHNVKMIKLPKQEPTSSDEYNGYEPNTYCQQNSPLELKVSYYLLQGPIF